MAKFIKLTNSVKVFITGEELNENEVIFNVDEIRSLVSGKKDGLYMLVPKLSNPDNIYARSVIGYSISKEDYEKAKSILLEGGNA